MTKLALTILVLAVIATGLVGCGPKPPPNTSIASPGDSSAQTTGVDSRDYNQVARALYDSMMMSEKLQEGSVVAFGPVRV